jgi:hypothetical protein
MTNWRAVGIGFVIEIVIGIFAFALPGIGHAAAGLIGGFVAGWIAGGGLGNGAWHGLLAGSIGGIVIAVLVALGATLLGTLGTGPFGVFIGMGTFAVALGVAVILALDSAIAGAIGGLLA